MLGVLPPITMRKGARGVKGFLVGEPANHNAKGVPMYAAYFKQAFYTNWVF